MRDRGAGGKRIFSIFSEENDTRANFIATKPERSCGGISPVNFWFK